MPRALIDTTVLFAAAYRRDGSRDAALPVLQGIDNGALPEAVVLGYVLAETLNILTTHAGHDAAVDLLDRIEENARFHIDSLTTDASRPGRPSFANTNLSPSSMHAWWRICKPRGSATCMRLTTILTLSRMSIDSIQQRIPPIQTDAGRRHGWRRCSVSE